MIEKIKTLFKVDDGIQFEYRGLKFEFAKSFLNSIKENEFTYAKVKKVSKSKVIIIEAHNKNNKDCLAVIPWGRNTDDILEILYGRIMSDPSTVVCIDGSIKWKGFYII